MGTVQAADVDRAGVSAGSVGSVTRGSGPVAEAETRLEQLIPLAIAGKGPVAVVENGRCIGTVSPEAAMAALVSEEGAAT